LSGVIVSAIAISPEGGLNPASEDDVHDTIDFGKERSFGQDFAFGLRQVSDIALKGVLIRSTLNDILLKQSERCHHRRHH
jgi:uncharacterized membrane protein